MDHLHRIAAGREPIQSGQVETRVSKVGTGLEDDRRVPAPRFPDRSRGILAVRLALAGERDLVAVDVGDDDQADWADRDRVIRAVLVLDRQGNGPAEQGMIRVVEDPLRQTGNNRERTLGGLVVPLGRSATGTARAVGGGGSGGTGNQGKAAARRYFSSSRLW